MFIPRIITLLVGIFCATVSGYAFTQVAGLPEGSGAAAGLLMAVVFFAALFAIAALVMLVGTWGMHRTPEGIVIDIDTLIGRMMNFIIYDIGRRSHAEEVHCCDVYTSTSLALFKGTCAIVTICLVVMYAYLAIVNGWMFLIPALVLAGIGAMVYRNSERVRSFFRNMNKRSENTASKLYDSGDNTVLNMRWGMYAGITVSAVILVIAVCVFVWLAIITPVMEFIALGYSLLAAIGIWFACVSMIAFPVYCMAGKKLLQRTGKFGKKVCPVVR